MCRADRRSPRFELLLSPIQSRGISHFTPYFLVPFSQPPFNNPAKITVPPDINLSAFHPICLSHRCVADLVACPCWPPPGPPPLRLRFLPFLQLLWFFQEPRLVGISACVPWPAVLCPEIPFDGDGCALRGSDFSVTGVSVVFPRSTKVPATPPPCTIKFAADFSGFAGSIK